MVVTCHSLVGISSLRSVGALKVMFFNSIKKNLENAKRGTCVETERLSMWPMTWNHNISGGEYSCFRNILIFRFLWIQWVVLGKQAHVSREALEIAVIKRYDFHRAPEFLKFLQSCFLFSKKAATTATLYNYVSQNNLAVMDAWRFQMNFHV